MDKLLIIKPNTALISTHSHTIRKVVLLENASLSTSTVEEWAVRMAIRTLKMLEIQEGNNGRQIITELLNTLSQALVITNIGNYRILGKVGMQALVVRLFRRVLLEVQ